MPTEISYDIATGATSEHEMSPELQAALVEQAWNDLRTGRDILLANSDWTVLTDTPTNKTAWKAYRQALRDLPANTTDPFNPVWPTPPD